MSAAGQKKKKNSQEQLMRSCLLLQYTSKASDWYQTLTFKHNGNLIL